MTKEEKRALVMTMLALSRLIVSAVRTDPGAGFDREVARQDFDRHSKEFIGE
jgi:hypothetical protein